MKELKYGKIYVCTSIRRLEWLRRAGFNPLRTECNIKNLDRLVWIFENSPELEAAVEEYTKQIPVNKQ